MKTIFRTIIVATVIFLMTMVAQPASVTAAPLTAANCTVTVKPVQPTGWSAEFDPTLCPAEYAAKFLANFAKEMSGTSAPPAPAIAPSAPITTTAPITPTATVAPTAANQCRDGEKIQPVIQANLNRKPIGLDENHSVYEVSWRPGTGFGDWNRFVLVVPKTGKEFQVFLLNTSTINGLRYCGTLEAVERWAPTHIEALRKSGADSAGNKVPEEEIGVYTLDLATGDLKVIKAAPRGPSLSEIKSHIEVVKVIK